MALLPEIEWRTPERVRRFVRPDAPNILRIQVTRDGESIESGATVSPGDRLNITINTDPAGKQGLFLIGSDPKPDCVLCGFSCASDSQHFIEQSFTGDSPVELAVSKDWPVGETVTIAPSVSFVLGGNELCLSSFPTFDLDVQEAEVPPPPTEPPTEPCTIDIAGTEVPCTTVAAGTLGLLGLAALIFME